MMRTNDAGILYVIKRKILIKRVIIFCIDCKIHTNNKLYINLI